MIAVAEVTTTPINAKKAIDGASPITCPLICAFWLLAYRVKSGMFNESVAQKPTMAVNAGKKKFQKEDPWSFAGCSNIGPNPFAALIAQNNNASAATGRKMALNINNFLILSTPR